MTVRNSGGGGHYLFIAWGRERGLEDFENHIVFSGEPRINRRQ